MVAKSIAKMYTNIHKPTDYRGQMCNLSWTPHSSLKDNYLNQPCASPIWIM